METRLVVTVDGRLAVTGSRQVNRAIDTVRRNARDMTVQVDGSFKRLQNSLFSVRNAIAALGIGEFVRRSLRSFADFEQGLVGVGKTTNLAGEELQALGRDIIAMSKRIPVARDELLGIAQAAGQLGITGSQNILKFTEVVAKMGRATDLVGEEAATTLARILNVTGESVDSVDRLGSALVFLGNNAAATEAEIAKMVIELSKGTAQFGVSSANLAGLGTTLKEFGQQAELARSTVLRTFLALKSATGEGGKELQLLAKLAGTTGEEFKQAFERDAFGAFLMFLEGLRSVIEQGGNAEKVLGALGLNGTEVNAILPLLAINFDKLSMRVEQANDAYRDNTALNKEAEQAFATFSSSLIKLGNNLLDAGRILGEQLAPAVTTLADKLTTLANSEGFVTFARALGVAFQFLADNIELVGLALGVLAVRKTIGLLTLLGSTVINVGRSLRLGATEAIAQAAGLNAASAAANLYVGGATRAAVASRNVALGTRLAAVGTFLLNTALTLVGLNLATVSGALSRFGKLVSGAARFLAPIASAAASIAARFVSLGAISRIAGLAVRGLAVAFGLLTGPIGIAVAVVTAIITAFELFKDTIVNVGNLNASVGNIVQATWNVTTRKIGEGFDAIAELADPVFTAIGDTASEVFNSIKTTVSGVVTDIGNFFGDLFEPVAGVFRSIGEVASETFTTVKDFIGEQVEGITGFFQSMFDTVSGIFTDIRDTVANTFSSLFSGIANFFSGFVTDVVNESNRLQQAEDNLKKVGEAAEDAATKVKQASGGVKVSDEPFGPPLPPSASNRQVNLDDLSGFLGGSGKGTGGASGLNDTLSQLGGDAERQAQLAGLDELGKRLYEVDQAVQKAVGSNGQLTDAQKTQVEATKNQIRESFQLEQHLKSQQEAQDRVKQLIEETLTPQERYNRAIEELNRLQPTTAEGMEAIRRRAAELRSELELYDTQLQETLRLTEEFNGKFESTFKSGLKDIFKNGKDGFKGMLDGFKDLYFDLLTELAARPILDFLLGEKTTLFGGRGGGPLSDFFKDVFGGTNSTGFGGGSGGPLDLSIPQGSSAPAGTASILPGDLIIPGLPDFSDIFGGGSVFGGGGLGGKTEPRRVSDNRFINELGQLYDDVLLRWQTLLENYLRALTDTFNQFITRLSAELQSISISSGGGIGTGGIPLPLPTTKPDDDFIGPPLPPDFGKQQGGILADVFADQSEGSGGFLGKLGTIFSGGGEGGGFLSSMSGLFDGLTGSLSGIFSSFGSIFSGLGGGLGGLLGGLGGGLGGGGGGSILGTLGGLVGNFFLPGVGGFLGNIAGNFLGGFFAEGGSVRGRTPIVVGERGPELFIPPVDGEIISNDVLEKVARSAGDNVIPFPKPKGVRTANDNALDGLPQNVVAGALQASMGGTFGGFFQGGGSVNAGSTIVTGERGRELFIPARVGGGTASADNDEDGGDTVVVNITVNTPDAVTFRRSQGQIASDAAKAIQRAKRNL